MFVVAAVLFAWTAACWFSQPFLEPFLGLWIFETDPAAAIAITLIWSAGAMLVWLMRSGKENLIRMLKALQENPRHYFLLALIILLFFSMQAPTIIAFRGTHDSDSALVGVTGYHIVDGKTRPIYFYGNHFNGSLVAHASALLHQLFGKCPVHLQIVNVLFYFGFLVSLYLLARRLWNGNVALLVALLAAIPPGWVHKLIRNTHVAPFVFFGALSLYLALRIIELEKPIWRQFFWIGVVLGIGFWVQLQMVFYAITVLIALFIKDKLFFIRPRSAAALPGLLGGAVPVFVDLFYYPGVMLSRFSDQTGTPLDLAGRFLPATLELLKNIPNAFGLPLIPAAGDAVNLIISAIVLAAALACLMIVIARNRNLLVDAVMLRNVDAGPTIFIIFLFATWFFISFTREASDKPPFRYFYLLWTAIPPILALGLGSIWKRTKALAVAGVLLFVMAFLSSGVMMNVQIAHRDGLLRGWVEFCDEHGITRFYGSYWRTYLTNFITEERIIGSNVFHWQYEQYPPYYYSVASSSLPPVYLFDRSTRGLQSVLENNLTNLGVSFIEVSAPIGTVVMDLSREVHPKQMLNLENASYNAVIESVNVSLLRHGRLGGERIYSLEFAVANNGSAALRPSAENGFVELVLACEDGREIRRQPLCADIPPGGKIKWRSLISRSEAGGETVFARLEVNGVPISGGGRPAIVSLATDGEKIDPKSFDPHLERSGGPNMISEDYLFFSGWGPLISRGDRLLRESSGRESVLGFILSRMEPLLVTAIIAPVKLRGFPLRPVGVKVRCNGKVIVERFALYFPVRLQMKISESELVAGLNTLSFNYDQIEPEYRRSSGMVIIRNTKRAVLLNRLIFRHARGERDSVPEVSIEVAQ